MFRTCAKKSLDTPERQATDARVAIQTLHRNVIIYRQADNKLMRVDPCNANRTYGTTELNYSLLAR
jgi:hypothetical protein